MSRIMRILDAYRSPDAAIYYTDTDSLCIHGSKLPLLARANLIGTGLGQLKCDLKPDPKALVDPQTKETLKDLVTGEPLIPDKDDLRFSKIIKAIWLAAKGPYSLIYVNPPRLEYRAQMLENQKLDERRLREKIRMKGIPVPQQHLNFFHSEELEMKLLHERLTKFKQIEKWLEDPTSHLLPYDIIKERIFIYKPKSENAKALFYKHPCYNLLDQIFKREGELFCIFGGMKRNFIDRANGAPLCIQPYVMRRQVCKNDWWQKSGRQHQMEDLQDLPYLRDFRLTFPDGYLSAQTRQNMNYQSFLDWQLRVAQEEDDF